MNSFLQTLHLIGMWKMWCTHGHVRLAILCLPSLHQARTSMSNRLVVLSWIINHEGEEVWINHWSRTITGHLASYLEGRRRRWWLCIYLLKRLMSFFVCLPLVSKNKKFLQTLHKDNNPQYYCTGQGIQKYITALYYSLCYFSWVWIEIIRLFRKIWIPWDPDWYAGKGIY